MRRLPWYIAASGAVAMLAGTTLAQPVNDRCSGALPADCNTVTFGTTVGATRDAEFTGCGGQGITAPGVWYVIDGTGGSITVDTCGSGTNFDTKLHAFRGDCSNAVCVAGNDDDPGCSGFRSKIVFSTDAGETYLILVSAFGEFTVGDFELNIVCETVIEDCNGNGIPDDLDIANGTSTDCNGNGIPDECENEYTTYDFPVNLPIPDEGSVSDTQNIGDSGTIGDVNVGVVITHTFLGDLTIDVAHNANTVRLWDRQCSSNDNMDVIFDDAGDPVLCGTPTVGTFQPAQPLSAFNGDDLFGDWEITVADNAALDVGTLNSWSLIIGVPLPLCCTGTLISSDTIPHGGIDAREEHEFCDPGHLTGLSSFDFTFDDSSNVNADCWVITETGGATPPTIVTVDQLGGNQIRLNLDRPITAGQWTSFGYQGRVPSVVDIGFLPGDVDQSGTATTFDIVSIQDCLNNQAQCAPYQVDMDRGGLQNGNDITRLIDILQAPNCDPFQWLNYQLPPQPNP